MALDGVQRGLELPPMVWSPDRGLCLVRLDGFSSQHSIDLPMPARDRCPVAFDSRHAHANRFNRICQAQIGGDRFDAAFQPCNSRGRIEVEIGD